MKKIILPGVTVSILIIVFFAARILSQKPDTKITAFNSSLEYEKKGDYQSAINQLLNIYNENKSNYLINLRLGWLYYSIQDNASSKKYYNTALEINRQSVEALLGLTFPLSALNDWNEVKKCYEEVLKLDPNNYTANLRLGQIHLNKMEYNVAKKYLEKVQAAYSSYYEPNLSLGYTYYYLGNVKKAEELFTYALMVSPNDSLATAGMKLVK